MSQPKLIFPRVDRLATRQVADDGTTVALLRFETGGRTFAIGIDRVLDVLERPSIAAFPDSKPGMIGVANIRGQIIPVRDCRSAGHPRSGEPSRLLVVEFKAGRAFGILVERVQKVTVKLGSRKTSGEIALDGKPVHYVCDEEGLK